MGRIGFHAIQFDLCSLEATGFYKHIWTSRYARDNNVACNIISRFDFQLEAANRETELYLSIRFFTRYNESTDWNLRSKTIKYLIDLLGDAITEDCSWNY